jgi:hypothetical protein
MIKRHYIVFSLFLFFILMLFLPYLIWAFKPYSHLNILVMNKTVPDKQRVEHRALFRVLVNLKFSPDWKKGYNYKKDYYGFFPEKYDKNEHSEIKRIAITEIDSLVSKYDFAYFADTYGVQHSDWGIDRPEELPNLIYGGLNQNDYLFLLKMYEEKKPVILEYNLMAPPTSDLIKAKVENLYGIYWSGWKGKYFGSLDKEGSETDVPQWIIEEWEIQNDTAWTFSRPGIIFINSKNRIVVLEKDTHLDVEVPLIIIDVSLASIIDPDELIYFTGWFDVSYTGTENNVLSHFEINTNTTGTAILKKFRIPSRFPAVIRNTHGSPFVYFCGNFARTNIPVSGGKSWLEGNFSRKSAYTGILEDRDFFQVFYRPLLKNLFVEFSKE